jgi:hypothetical protein
VKVNKISLARLPLHLDYDLKDIDLVVHRDLIRCRMTKPTPNFFPAGLQLLLPSAFFASHPKKILHTPGPLAPSAKGDG